MCANAHAEHGALGLGVTSMATVSPSMARFTRSAPATSTETRSSDPAPPPVARPPTTT